LENVNIEKYVLSRWFSSAIDFFYSLAPGNPTEGSLLVASAGGMDQGDRQNTYDLEFDHDPSLVEHAEVVVAIVAARPRTIFGVFLAWGIAANIWEPVANIGLGIAAAGTASFFISYTLYRAAERFLKAKPERAARLRQFYRWFGVMRSNRDLTMSESIFDIFDGTEIDVLLVICGKEHIPGLQENLERNEGFVDANQLIDAQAEAGTN
jgi:hypothetical protein